MFLREYSIHELPCSRPPLPPQSVDCILLLACEKRGWSPTVQIRPTSKREKELSEQNPKEL
jgi:hypothetical protein